MSAAKQTKNIGTIVVLILVCAFGYKLIINTDDVGKERFTPEIEKILTDQQIVQKTRVKKTTKTVPQNATGSYLSSYFAQNRHDWKNANGYLLRVIQDDNENIELLKRSMILAIGDHDLDLAAKHARKLSADGDTDALTTMIIVLQDTKNEKYEEALSHLDEMDDDDMTGFIKPMLKGWLLSKTQEDYKPSIDSKDITSVHTYHKALIAYANGQADVAKEIVKQTRSYPNLTILELERLGDLYVVLDAKDEALKIYGDIIQQIPEYDAVADKAKAIKEQDDEALKRLTQSIREVKTVQDGVAQALYDMAFILYQERSMTSTRIFASLALMMNEDMVIAHVLLGEALIHVGRYKEAIDHLVQLPETYPNYLATQRRVSDLYAENDQDQKARDVLMSLFDNHDDVEALIKVGDLYRHEEKYDKALKVYNQAAEHIGEPLNEDYWHLLYARGMAYEREENWDKAEADLLAAKEYQPDNPYLLNYLGYGWADQGIKLNESLDLIKKALELRPQDGYITDSLGWVYYMSGQYSKAIPHLERAVELLPYDATINDHLGDAYWRVGRQIEAKFQWERAKNNIDSSAEDDLLQKVEQKLKSGLPKEEESKKFKNAQKTDVKKAADTKKTDQAAKTDKNKTDKSTTE